MAIETAVSGPTTVVPTADAAAARPTERLPMRQLIQLSIYWLGINSIMGGLGVVVQKRIPALVPAPWDGPAVALQSVLTMIMAAAIQPTIGVLSDHTISRWGRRKPYIAIGASLDLLFLFGIGTANSYVALLAFLVAIQFSSNFAQGPFQGLVPDLVPQRQVAFASALVGIMQTGGFVLGTVVITYGVTSNDYLLPLLFLGGIQLATAIGTLLWVREKKAPTDRKGRSWVAIARSAWGTDILREKSFLNLVISRLMFIAGINMLLGFYVWFMERSLLMDTGQQGFWIPVTAGTVALLTLIATIPSARLSDRIGRKPVIYAACTIGGLGMAITAVAPSIEVFVIGVIAIGVASGTFLAVDWALMTDIIPRSASGRYMGISNIAVVAGGPFASVIGGGLIFFFGGAVRSGDGPRAAFAAAIGLFALAAFFLRRVDARPREERLLYEAASPAPA
ncbi:MAG: MFS transporter [Candidatus Limnocylindrales bacterium]